MEIPEHERVAQAIPPHIDTSNVPDDGIQAMLEHTG
jgi:hypothetical protein